MSQHSFSIPNEAGAAYRADVNAALQALASQSSGTSAPATMYAYQFWADTTNGVLKQRNAANSGWIVRGTLAETLVIARSSNTILGIGDYGRTIYATSTFTQTLTAAATLGDGWWCDYRNDGSGVITLDADGSEQINGIITLALQPGESCILLCTGSGFKTVGLTQPRTIVRRKTADESVTTSTTLQDDDHLTFPIAANEEWIANISLMVGAALNTTGFKASITVPAGATLGRSFAAVGGSATCYEEAGTGGSVSFTTAHALGSDAQVNVTVWVLNGATPGNVTLQWAQDTSSGTAVTVKKGSNLTAHRVA